MRVFVAVFPPPDVREALDEWIGARRRPGDGISWVRAGNLHYTLRFLGEIEERRVERVARAARAAVEGLAPFEMTLGRAGAFPNFRRPRVLWIGAETGGETLEVLARSLEEALRREGFGRADKPFRAHLTVGRVRNPRPDRSLEERLAAGRGPMGRFTVDGVDVVHSQLHPKGSIYRTVAEAALEAAGEGSGPAGGAGAAGAPRDS